MSSKVSKLFSGGENHKVYTHEDIARFKKEAFEREMKSQTPDLSLVEYFENLRINDNILSKANIITSSSREMTYVLERGNSSLMSLYSLHDMITDISSSIRISDDLSGVSLDITTNIKHNELVKIKSGISYSKVSNIDIFNIKRYVFVEPTKCTIHTSIKINNERYRNNSKSGIVFKLIDILKPYLSVVDFGIRGSVMSYFRYISEYLSYSDKLNDFNSKVSEIEDCMIDLSDIAPMKCEKDGTYIRFKFDIDIGYTINGFTITKKTTDLFNCISEIHGRISDISKDIKVRLEPSGNKISILVYTETNKPEDLIKNSYI